MRSQFSFKADLEIEEINDIPLCDPGKKTSVLVSGKKESLQHSVGQITQNSRHHEPCSQPQGENIEGPSHPEKRNQAKRHYRYEKKDERCPWCIVSHSESRPLIVHPDNREEILDHDVILVRYVVAGGRSLETENHDPIRYLIKRVERKDQKEEEAR